MTISSCIHMTANSIILFLLWLSSIPFYIYICMYVYQIFFIHLSANGHLGCFYVLAIVNSAVINTVARVSF